MFNKIICLNDRNKDKNKKYRKYLKIIISCSKSIIKKKWKVTVHITKANYNIKKSSQR